MGKVSQMVNGGDKLLQEFSDVLGHTFQLQLEPFFQVVVTLAIVKRLRNLIVHTVTC